MKGLKMLILTAFVTLFTAVSAFGETVRVIQIDLTYNGKTVQYREQEVSVIVDGKRLENLDMPAVIIDDRTLVPLRAIFESMGASVSWDGDTQKITADFDNGDNIVMFINNKAGVANGNAFNMDVAPMIINDRTMVPVRAVAEAVGADVGWDNATRTVTVNSYIIGGDASEEPEQPDNEPEQTVPEDNRHRGHGNDSKRGKRNIRQY